MRYVAKVYVLDVLDQIVVSGYVRDSEALDIPTEEPFEFTWQDPGVGEPRPAEWLAGALASALLHLRHQGSREAAEQAFRGGQHTISESGDRRREGVGLTVVGGAARDKPSGRRSAQV